MSTETDMATVYGYELGYKDAARDIATAIRASVPDDAPDTADPRTALGVRALRRGYLAAAGIADKYSAEVGP